MIGDQWSQRSHHQRRNKENLIIYNKKFKGNFYWQIILRLFEISISYHLYVDGKGIIIHWIAFIDRHFGWRWKSELSWLSNLNLIMNWVDLICDWFGDWYFCLKLKKSVSFDVQWRVEFYIDILHCFNGSKFHSQSSSSSSIYHHGGAMDIWNGAFSVFVTIWLTADYTFWVCVCFLFFPIRSLSPIWIEHDFCECVVCTIFCTLLISKCAPMSGYTFCPWNNYEYLRHIGSASFCLTFYGPNLVSHQFI